MVDGRADIRYMPKRKERKVYHSVYGKSYEEVKEKLNLKKEFIKGYH